MAQPTEVSGQSLLGQLASLLLYQSVLTSEVSVAFIDLLQALENSTHTPLDCLKLYGRWFRALADQQMSWPEYLVWQILKDENPFSRQAQQAEWSELPASLTAAAQHDLKVLQQLHDCSAQQVVQWVQQRTQSSHPQVSWELSHPARLLPPDSIFFQTADRWAAIIEPLASYYHRWGTGIFAEYWAARWQSGQLEGIAHPDPVKVADLVGYETPKQMLIKNTEFLLAGYPALHVLLYGSRGSGKSSLVKGLLTEYGDRGLRLIEVVKSELSHLPEIVEQLRGLPQKFIIFVDDLSFEEDEATYKALKVVLEGNVTARPANVVVYATSNRRHLIREFFGDRPLPKDADEIHNWDTVQEKLSFSDRFGLTLTFEPANQDTYLEIVRSLAAQAGLTLNPESLEFEALQWATRHNGRSGRTARQFVDFLQADLQSKLLNEG